MRCLATRKVPSLKRTFGGKKAFHEKLVLGRSRAFADEPEGLVLAPLEVAYIFNFVQWTNGRKDILQPLLERVQHKLDELTKCSDASSDMRYFDKLAYLTFLRAVFLKHLGNWPEAMALFQDVYSWREQIATDHHLPAQAAYELGLGHRHAQDYELASSWLHKAHRRCSAAMLSIT